MYCTKIVDGQMCGSSVRTRVNADGFVVCRKHRLELASQALLKKDRAVAESDTETTIYIIRTPRGTLKLGQSQKLPERLKDLHRAFSGPVQLLASFPGTFKTESELHVRFKDFRVDHLLGEQFADVPEIRDFADEQGIDDTGLAALRSYARYKPTGTAQKTEDYFNLESI